MKKNKKIAIISFVLVCLVHALPAHAAAVTYLDSSQWGGRFGDKMIMYVKARWIAFTYNIPFFYKPFQYSDQLMMHEMDTPWQPSLHATFKKKTHILKSIETDQLNALITQGTDQLYIIHYYFMLPQWGLYQQQYDSQEVSEWKDLITNEQFRTELRQVISPRRPIETCSLPPDRISVAVHVRKGGGFDRPLLSLPLYDDHLIMIESYLPYTTKEIYSDRVWPLKFLPDQYYIDQIRRISELLNNAPLYVHIFTDHQDPSALAALYKAAVNKPNIIYGYREQDNHHSKNILEDLFGIAKCDCLIRGGSNFPQIAQLISKHRIVIYPQSIKWIGRIMVVDKVGTIFNEPR